MEKKHKDLELKPQAAEEKTRKAELELQKSTLIEYFDLCHEYLSKSISVQTDMAQSTKGDPANAKGKLRPDHIRPWEDFIDTQKTTLETLYSLYPTDNMPRVFDSCHSIKTQGEKVASLKLASERDLLILQHTIVETPVTEIVNHLKSVDSVCKKFGLAGGIKFHNHKNALSDDADEVAQRLEAQQLGLPSGPQPDSVCVFTTVELLNKPALVVEYKAPTNSRLLTSASSRTPTIPRWSWTVSSMRCRCLRTKTKWPTSNTMPNDWWLPSSPKLFLTWCAAGLSLVISPLESFLAINQYLYYQVFLYIKVEDNAKTVYYHLAEPHEDVNAQKKGYPNTNDYLHRTAISQVLAFSVLALASAQDNREWREGVIGTLETWEVDYNTILKEMPKTPEPTDKSSPFLFSSCSQTYSLGVLDRSPLRQLLHLLHPPSVIISARAVQKREKSYRMRHFSGD